MYRKCTVEGFWRRGKGCCKRVQHWAGLKGQGASNQEGDVENAFKAPIIFRSYLPRSVSTVSARSEMLRALGEGGVMQES